MNQIYQGESSGGPSVQPVKRRRGRPRKDPALKQAAVSAPPPPPGFDGRKEYVPQQAHTTVTIDPIVGQGVTGVVEASFDAGYLLSVRIGNSNTNLRGIVFKPGHYLPITAENDVAPHLQMIRRNDVHLPQQNQGRSRGQSLAIQTTGVVSTKRKYTPAVIAPVVPPVGIRGTVTPVILQPVNYPNGLPNTIQMRSEASHTATMMAFGDKDVHMVEPISMLPPDQSIPVNQIFAAVQMQSNHQVKPETEQKDNASVAQGIFEGEQGEKAKPVVSTNNIAGSSQTSGGKTENSKEVMKSSVEDSSVGPKHLGVNIGPPSNESQQIASAPKPFFNYGTGRMTELLQAVQENIKENQVQIAEQRPSESKVELQEPRN